MPQGVPLFDDEPVVCLHGHRLGPGRVTRGWQPCVCQHVMDAREERHSGLGHLWVKCRPCAAAGRRSFYYEPPHFDPADRVPGAVFRRAGPGLWVSTPRAEPD
jgi:hypothetical protein